MSHESTVNVPGYGQNESLRDRYNVYVQCATSLGHTVKSFEEWLNS